MRVLLLLRGSAGCGKSTWIEQNGLKPYTLSADDIRLLCQSPIMTVDGKEAISQSNDKVVWQTLFRILETRMQNGEFTVIDATNSKTAEMNRYKNLCSTYRYRIYCVDFTDIPIEVVKERNANREVLKRVPEFVIDKMYSRFATQKIPSGIVTIKPDELDKIWLKMFDMSEYKKVHIIGDIHGCNTALQEYFNVNGGFKDDELYIFSGDYVDRGIENAELMKFLLSIYKKDNVLLLEGNHERWLWIYAHDGVTASKEFELFTRAELDNAKIDKKELRQFYRKLGQCAYYKYGDNVYLVTHGGLSAIPNNLTFVSTKQMIHGVGNYNDFEIVANTFMENTPSNYYQIHGHRNTKQVPVQVNDRVFNLEGQVEFGGHLRCVQFDIDGNYEVYEVKNDIFKEHKIVQPEDKTEKSLADIIIDLRNSKFVQEKKYGNISAFNFTKNAFYDKVWNEQTIKARGLYIDVPKQKVVARAYEKFFNINEREETKFDMLQHKLQFPVTAYVKENGFLGIISYDEYNDDLFITTKSNPDGDYAKWFKELLYNTVDTDTIKSIKEYTKEHNVSLVFECVDMKNDPHIIDYPTSQVILLEIIYNDIKFKKYEYNDVCFVANSFGFKHKEKAYELANWQEFFDWYYEVTDENYEYNGRNIEGFVIEDANGYMVKLKLAYYNFWKFMRSISHETLKKGYITRTSALTTSLANEYYGWVKSLYNIEDKESIPKDICALRKMFYDNKTK